MARARLLKPGFFTNKALASIPPYGRLLFAGLWTLADRQGRLKDSPKFIEGSLFPYDKVPVDKLLDQLEDLEFIQRYQVDGDPFIQVLHFTDHQTPNSHEQESNIPPPPAVQSTDDAYALHMQSTEDARAMHSSRAGDGNGNGNYSGSGSGSRVPEKARTSAPLHALTDEFIESQKPEFPAVNVWRVAEELRAYIDDHPRKYKNPCRTLVVWLRREEDRIGERTGTHAKSNGFSESSGIRGPTVEPTEFVLDP